MAEPAKRLATYADLEAVPPHLVAEIIHGTLVTHPRPAPRHANATFSLGNLLGPGYQSGRGGPGGWVFFTEPELHLGRHVVVPDIGGWLQERLPAYPNTAYFETPPDWACEVLSDATEDYYPNAKRDIYATFGVSYLWLLDPRSKILEVFQLTAGRWLLAGNFSPGDEVRAAPFDAVAFPLSELWPLDPPPEIIEEQ